MPFLFRDVLRATDHRLGYRLRDSVGLYTSHVIPAMIRKVIAAEDTVELWETEVRRANSWWSATAPTHYRIHNEAVD